MYPLRALPLLATRKRVEFIVVRDIFRLARSVGLTACSERKRDFWHRRESMTGLSE